MGQENYFARRYCLPSEALTLTSKPPWIPLLITAEILSPALTEITSIVSEQETSVLPTLATALIKIDP
jgi:hypothetical protein